MDGRFSESFIERGVKQGLVLSSALVMDPHLKQLQLSQLGL